MINEITVNRCAWSELLLTGARISEKTRMLLLQGPEMPDNVEFIDIDDETSDLYLQALAHLKIARCLLKRTERAL